MDAAGKSSTVAATVVDIRPMNRRLLASFVALVIVAGTAAAQPIPDYVPDVETASAVATAILKARLGKEKFETLSKTLQLSVELNGEVWSAYFYPRGIKAALERDKDSSQVTVVAGGGFPILEISKHDGRVVSYYFSK